MSLLVKTTGPNVALRGYQRQAVIPSPHGHFLLLPSVNSLLLKSIAISELMLPSDVQSSVEGPCDNALAVVASCLDQVLHVHVFFELAVAIAVTRLVPGVFLDQTAVHDKHWDWYAGKVLSKCNDALNCDEEKLNSSHSWFCRRQKTYFYIFVTFFLLD